MLPHTCALIRLGFRLWCSAFLADCRLRILAASLSTPRLSLRASCARQTAGLYLSVDVNRVATDAKIAKQYRACSHENKRLQNTATDQYKTHASRFTSCRLATIPSPSACASPPFLAVVCVALVTRWYLEWRRSSSTIFTLRTLCLLAVSGRGAG